MTALESTLPVFLVIAIGFWLAGRVEVDLGALSDLSLRVTSPALIFTVLASTPMQLDRIGWMVGGTAFIVGGTGLVGWLVFRRHPDRAGLLLCSMFWNAGNMVLPTAQLAFGAEGLGVAALPFVTMTALQSSLGVWIAGGRRGWATMFRVPLLYASLGGIVVSATGWSLPTLALAPLTMLAAAAIPLLLIQLGMRLRGTSITTVRLSAAAVAIRMLVGGALGVAFVSLTAVGGLERKILLLNAAMPAAVLNVAFAERFGASPRVVGSSIALGTVIALVTVPTIVGALLD